MVRPKREGECRSQLRPIAMQKQIREQRKRFRRNKAERTTLPRNAWPPKQPHIEGTLRRDALTTGHERAFGWRLLNHASDAARDTIRPRILTARTHSRQE
jgi:hypothetical protein